jgi:hypothetical protein
MRIQYSVPGKERKNLAVAVAQELETTVKYLGMPSAAYQIGNYRLDKDGLLTGADNRDLVADLQGLHSFIPVSEKYDEASEAEVYAERELRRMNLESLNVPDYSNRSPYGGDSIQEDWENGMTEEEKLGLGRRHRERQGENGMQPDDYPEYFTYKAELSDPDYPDRFEVFTATSDLDAYHLAMDFCKSEVTLLELQQLNEKYEPVRWVDLQQLLVDNDLYDTLEIEVPKNGMTDAKVQNLMKLVESKRSLLAMALGRPLEIKDSGESLLFEFPYDNNTGAGNIYAQFATALMRFAAKSQRVNSVEKPVDSEKFALRTLMIRLGMSGNEYAAARKYLLRNLSGNSCYAKNAAYIEMQSKRRNGR